MARAVRGVVGGAVDVRDFGAVGDGCRVNTAAIERAIAHASETGAQKVVVPPGVFVTGTVVLRSKLTLELLSGAVLKASTSIADFPERAVREGEHVHQDHSRRSFILADGCEDLTVCGGGTIDGSNEAYAAVPREKRGPYRWFGYVRDSYQPALSFRRCRNLRLLDITVQNTVRWNVHLFMCERVWVERVCIVNDPFAGNSDGIDIDGCRDVLISNTKIDTGDDAIVLKTLLDSQSCERITVTGCILKSTCAAFKIGTESFHDFRHITYANCVVHQSPRAFEIVVFDGGNVEDVVVNGLTCDTNCGVTMCRPIHIDSSRRLHGYAPLGDRGEYPPGAVRRVSISNCTIETDGRILLTAAHGAQVEQISLRNVHVHMPWIEDPRDVADLSDAMQSSNASPVARLARAAIVAKDIRGLSIDGYSVSYPRGPVGSDYVPTYEHAQLVRDPRERFEPMPPLSVLWARGVSGGYVNLRGCVPYGTDAPLADMDECSLEVST